jgi:dephospho-CoA kinase
VVGLIGGIGSGKSAVAAAFARQGAVVVSGDVAGHEALQQPKIRDQVVQRWGQGMMDDRGQIDRRKLAAIVFNDPAERKTLEAMVFPWIERRLREQIMAAKQDRRTPLIILDAAVMLEAGWSKECDRMLFVDAPTPLRLKRLAEGRGWTENEVRSRERAQMPSNEKRSRADAILENTGSLEELNQPVSEFLKRWGIEGQGERKTGQRQDGALHDPLIRGESNENDP